jgi:LysR family hydrogen peroxide-inducible transcriptional activator
MKPLPSLRQLRYVVALEQHRHFAHAASACDISQSTLSAGIRDLEALLGVQVAERDRHGVVITAVGQQVAERARRILSEAENLLDMCAFAAAPLSGDLKLGSIPTIGPFVLPRLLPHLKQRFPALDIHLREDKTKALLAQLAERRLDLLLIAFPYDTPDCDTMMLFKDSYRFACSADDPLAKSDAVSSRDMATRRLMLLEPEHCLHSHALPVLENAARNPNTTFAATSLQTLVAMVSVGMGSTLLPELAIDGGILKGSTLVTRPLGYRAGVRQIGLCWRRNSPRADEFRQIGEAMREWSEVNLHAVIVAKRG